MQRGHRDDSQRVFPLASGNPDIASREVTPPPDPERQSSRLRTEAVSTVTPTARLPTGSGEWRPPLVAGSSEPG
jgi:hypothetical protein